MPTIKILPLIIVFVLIVFGAPARGQVPDTSHYGDPDSAVSAFSPDSVSAYPELLPGVGQWPGFSIAGSTIPDTLYPYIEARSIAGFFRSEAGLFTHELGQGGLGRFLGAQGLTAGSMVYLADGFPLADPSGAPFNIDIYPPEFSGLVEYTPPGTAFLRALNGSAGTVNLVSSNNQAVRPVSGIRYSQSAYGYSLIDGTVSQDVARGLNVTLGAHHPVYDGRFINSALNGWGGRVKLRYDMTGAAVYLSDIFTRWERGLNDGVSPSTIDSLRFDRIRALVNNPSATEKLVRHDLHGGATVQTDSGGTTYLFEFNFSSVHREYRDDTDGESVDGPAVRETRRSQWYGLRAAHTREIAGQSLSVNFMVQNRRVLEHPLIGDHRSLQSSVGGSLGLRLIPGLSLVPMVRFDSYMENSRLSFGGDADLQLAGPVSVRGGVSHTYLYPSFGEISGIGPVVGAAPGADPEQHDMLTAGIVANDSGGNLLSLDMFYRNIRNRIIMRRTGPATGAEYAYESNGTETRRGVTLRAAVRAGSFTGEATVDQVIFGKNFVRETTPRWHLRAGVFYRDRMIEDHLDLKLGFQGRYFTSYAGLFYSHRYETFFPSDERIPPAAILDFVLVAGIGDAHIHFVWENLLGREYITTVYYPMDDRALRFGVRWDFID